MQHKVKFTVIDKKLYPDLQEQYCANKNAGMCSCYNVGDEFIFERYDTADDLWHMGLNTLKQAVTTADGTAGSASFFVLFRSMGCHFALYLCRFIGRIHHARLDVQRKGYDCLLF